ncbi:DUF6093 family protein [Streptomyces sp. 21So2-11]|uniref:DUF6093 family protein n=1 Tax=Streptomyces sp. 21So2-11 TaxID=3144408 RepID=UPI00321A658A
MLDQSGIARFAEQHLMPDKVKATRGTGDDVFDSSTGDLIPADPVQVYAGAAGLYGHQERIRGKGDPSGAWVEEALAGYRMLLPLAAPEVWENDMVLVVEARDEQAVGRTYRVTALGEVSSFPVVRTVWLEEHNRKTSAP